MAIARGRGTRHIAQMNATRTGTPVVDRAQDSLVLKLNEVISNPLTQAVAIRTKLLPGLNKVAHGQRRPLREFLWSANAAVTIHNRQAENPHPDREFWVQVSGAAPVQALLFLMPSA